MDLNKYIHTFYHYTLDLFFLFCMEARVSKPRTSTSLSTNSRQFFSDYMYRGMLFFDTVLTKLLSTTVD